MCIAAHSARAEVANVEWAIVGYLGSVLINQPDTQLVGPIKSPPRSRSTAC